MKKLTVLLALICMSFGCTKEYDYPEKTVNLSYDRFITNSFDAHSAARAATDFKHILSTSSVADVIATPSDPNIADVRLRTKVTDLKTLTLKLKVGVSYVINITYERNFADGTTKWLDNGLAFDAVSDPITITSTTSSIMMRCSTDQSLILLDKEGIDPTFGHKYSDGTTAWLLFEDVNFWYIYLNPPSTARNLVQYQTIDGVLRNVEFVGNLEPETTYFISETEVGNIQTSYDYDNIFGGLYIVNL